MKRLRVFIIVLLILLVTAEIGVRYSGWGKEGDFIMIFFYSALFSGAASLAFINHKENE